MKLNVQGKCRPRRSSLTGAYFLSVLPKYQLSEVQQLYS